MKTFMKFTLIALMILACQGKQETTSKNEEAPIAPLDGLEPSECVCMEIYQPVCGKDGRTYGNSCLAECRGVEVKSAGECLETH
jgi:hypothetical protein